jgi:predicted signal transduction protein with EAL and GGDEF domain
MVGGDTVARLGGDEFAVLLEELADPSDALRRVDGLQAQFERPFEVDGRQVYTGATMGIALWDRRYERPDEMLRDADLAMYRAKAVGGGQRLVFDPEMHRLAIERLDLESALRRAVERGEFELHYQPIVDLGSGGVEGLEALVRWRHPQRGLLHPEAFLEATHETGLILPLGRWVLETACAAVERWRRRWPRLAVYVNLGAGEFNRADLVDGVAQVLAGCGLPAAALRLELTEGVVMSDPVASRGILQRLRELGVGLVIDDFGTGYSSLSHLHRLPMDTVKVDRSFLARLGPDGAGRELLFSIASLARSLSLRTIAEGVETPAQLAAVRDLGYDAAQGFLVSRPLDPDGVEDLLAGDPRW